MKREPIVLVVDHGYSVREVALEASLIGMHVKSAMRWLGMIEGDVDADRVEALRRMKGVLRVDPVENRP